MPDFHPLHKVPFLDDKKYFWVSHTPEGETAFNNQCSNPIRGYAENKRHGAKVVSGINQSYSDTPLYCEKCGSLLPRPCVEDKDGIGKLDDIEVVFLHYKSEEEAYQKWNRRKKRINYNNLIFKFNDMNLAKKKMF